MAALTTTGGQRAAYGRLRAGAPEVAFAALGVATVFAYAYFWLRVLWLADFRPFSGPALSEVPILGADWSGVGKYGAAVAAPVCLYVAALLLLPRLKARAAWTIAIAVAVAAPLVLLYTYPALAADVFDYLMIGRLLSAHHVNPYTHAPLYAPSDPYFAPVGWKELESVYGPAWVLVMGGITALFGDSAVAALLFTKAVAVLAHWASAALVYVTARRLDPGKALFAFVAYAWNPLVLLYAAVDGHNDSFLLLFVIGAVYLGLSRRWELSFLSLMAAALIKFVPLVLFPWFIWRARRDGHAAFLGIGLAVLLAVAMYAPFWAGSSTFDGVRDQASRMTSSPAALAGFYVRDSWLRPAAVIVFSAGYVVLLRGRLNLAEGAYAVLLLYLLVLSFWTKPWYFTWPIALGAVVGGTAFWVSVPGMAGLFASNVFGGWGWAMDWWRWQQRWGLRMMEAWLTSTSIGGWALAWLAVAAARLLPRLSAPAQLRASRRASRAHP
jgi:alpha-1,6-mannosyltransferase